MGLDSAPQPAPDTARPSKAALARDRASCFNETVSGNLFECPKAGERWSAGPQEQTLPNEALA